MNLVGSNFAAARDLIGTKICPVVRLLGHENADWPSDERAIIETLRATKRDTMISRNEREVGIPRTL
jgi:hypothetical protein